MEITDRVLRFAKERGLNDQDLCKILGISKSGVYHWKKGSGEPTARQLLLLAQYFGVTTDYLLRGRVEQNLQLNILRGDNTMERLTDIITKDLLVAGLADIVANVLKAIKNNNYGLEEFLQRVGLSMERFEGFAKIAAGGEYSEDEIINNAENYALQRLLCLTLQEMGDGWIWLHVALNKEEIAILHKEIERRKKESGAEKADTTYLYELAEKHGLDTSSPEMKHLLAQSNL